MGRKTKYSKQIADDAESWIEKNGLIDYGGATVKDFLANCIHVDWVTYKKWLDIHPYFKECVQRGKDKFKAAGSDRLVKSLFKAAEGYVTEDETETTEFTPNANGTPSVRKLVKTKTKRHVKADIGAAIFLLTNLDPEHYQNRQRNDIAIRKEDDKEMSIDEINAEIERLEKLEKKK